MTCFIMSLYGLAYMPSIFNFTILEYSVTFRFPVQAYMLLKIPEYNVDSLRTYLGKKLFVMLTDGEWNRENKLVELNVHREKLYLAVILVC